MAKAKIVRRPSWATRIILNVYTWLYIYCERSQERKKLDLIANLRLFTYTDIFILVLPRVLKMFLTYFSIGDANYFTEIHAILAHYTQAPLEYDARRINDVFHFQL
jgi:hypothetical protein